MRLGSSTRGVGGVLRRRLGLATRLRVSHSIGLSYFREQTYPVCPAFWLFWSFEDMPFNMKRVGRRTMRRL